MELVTPGLGLIFWQAITFLIVLFILSRFAWKPIMGAIHEREQTIERALSEAERARREIKALTSQNEEIIRQAQQERSRILDEANKQAQATRAQIEGEARARAEEIGRRAQADIINEREKAKAEIRNLVADLSLQIASRVVREKLQDDQSQQQLIDRLLAEAQTTTANQ